MSIRNVKFWEMKRSQGQRKRARESEKLTVCCLVSANKGFGPFYFASAKVIGAGYKRSLNI